MKVILSFNGLFVLLSIIFFQTKLSAQKELPLKSFKATLLSESESLKFEKMTPNQHYLE